ncbi:MAG: AAA family ATPase [Nitrososphaeraceae archaeon]
MIIIICGLPGSGKTFLANKLLSYFDTFTILSTDKIRKELFQVPSYNRFERSIVYDVMILIAKYLHSTGISCILDGTFNRNKSRNEVKEKLGLKQNQIYIIECTCPENIIMSRLLCRNKDDLSDADISVYWKMKKIYEPVETNHTSIDTSKPIDLNLGKIIKDIKKNLIQ